jgi:hypothetical protein
MALVSKNKDIDRDMQRKRLIDKNDRPTVDEPIDRISIEFGQYRVLIEPANMKEEIIKKRRLVR